VSEPKRHKDTPESSLEKKVRTMERRRDTLRGRLTDYRGNPSYVIAEANALDFAVTFIENHWEEACELIEKRRAAR
jgi:hypothetical protein